MVNSTLIRPYSWGGSFGGGVARIPMIMVLNNPIIRPYLWGRVALRGALLDSHWPGFLGKINLLYPGSPKTKLCPLVVGNPLHGSS